ncbi:hypothetical protein PVW47_01550 [Marinovum sp. SP66]|uniref:hypothetical protein n=1 Tax=Marinovum TaxID=367771 RepID=UPI00237BD89A|nr:hypothetical protein [Marinovum sp. SP66]MDD9738458.1 hypothetical protein [Marinovum sp. SP66]
MRDLSDKSLSFRMGYRAALADLADDCAQRAEAARELPQAPALAEEPRPGLRAQLHRLAEAVARWRPWRRRPAPDASRLAAHWDQLGREAEANMVTALRRTGL